MDKLGIFFLGSVLLLGGCAKGQTQNTSSLSNNETTNITVAEESDESTGQEIPVFSRIYKIYINPSVQVNNMYAGGLGSEAEIMQKLSELMVDELAKVSNIEVRANKSKGLTQSLNESNTFNPDIHLALHSNAGGGKGSEVFFAGDYQFAETILNEFLTLGNFANRGVKDGNHLYEVRTSKAPAVALMEFLFHDNFEEATFIVENLPVIAKTMTTALVKYISIID